MNSFLNFLSMAGAALFMVFFFGLCIFIHELGHFLAAKWRGLHVTAFSIGFKKAWGKTWHGVEYRIGWFPFGGYVEIPQVDGDGKKENGKDANLPPAKPLDRMIAVVAGPLFNFLFGFVIAAVIWIVGIPQDTPDMKEIEVASIAQDSPEYRAGLRVGDVITQLNGKPLNTSWNGVFKDILTTVGPVTMQIRRGNETFQISYLPQINSKVLPDEEIAYPFFLPKLPIVVYPAKDSPAGKAGVLKGDKILAVNDKHPVSISEFEELIDQSNGNAVTLTLSRNGKEHTISGIIPKPEKIQGMEGTWKVGVYYSPAAEQLTVLDIVKGTPAEKAGLLKNDIIRKIDGKVPVPAEFPVLVQNAQGKTMKLSVERAGKPLEIDLIPVFHRYYSIGVEYAYIAHPTPWTQFTNVMSLTFKSMRAIGYSLGNRVGLTQQQTTVKAKHMSGPIGIGRILYRSVRDGSLMIGLNIVVMITFSLGLLNLFPIPVLDGGHFVLALIELIFRKPVPECFIKPISYAFVGILIAFMLFVTFYDAKRVIGDLTPPASTVKTAAPGK